MSLATLPALLALVVAVWFWADSMRARETAIAVAKRACAAEGVLLLNGTGMTSSLTVRRDTRGRLRIMRIYEFEFSDSGNNRLTGSVTLLGHDLQTLYLPPHASSRTATAIDVA